MVEITRTRDYRLFGRNTDNRKLSLEKHKKLRQSTEEYGFIAGYPVVCFSGPAGQLVVLDGQHRLANCPWAACRWATKAKWPAPVEVHAHGRRDD